MSKNKEIFEKITNAIDGKTPKKDNNDELNKVLMQLLLNKDEAPPKKIRKKRVNTEERKQVLRDQLIKARASSLNKRQSNAVKKKSNLLNPKDDRVDSLILQMEEITAMHKKSMLDLENKYKSKNDDDEIKFLKLKEPKKELIKEDILIKEPIPEPIKPLKTIFRLNNKKGYF